MSDFTRVAVDVGNSSLKLATSAGPVDSADQNLRFFRISLSNDAWLNDVAAITKDVCPEGAPIQWMLASVNSIASDQLAGWIASTRRSDRCDLIRHQDIGIAIDVRFPDRVGIDRLLAAKGAYHRADRRAAMVIDAGTTITVDLVDEAGAFRGGAILPGIGLQFRALHEATDRLPLISSQQGFVDSEYPGRDTEAAMTLGVVTGVLGSIENMLDSVKQSHDLQSIFLTGGDAERIADRIEHPLEVVTELPLRTLYSL